MTPSSVRTASSWRRATASAVCIVRSIGPTPPRRADPRGGRRAPRPAPGRDPTGRCPESSGPVWAVTACRASRRWSTGAAGVGRRVGDPLRGVRLGPVTGHCRLAGERPCPSRHRSYRRACVILRRPTFAARDGPAREPLEAGDPRDRARPRARRRAGGAARRRGAGHRAARRRRAVVARWPRFLDGWRGSASLPATTSRRTPATARLPPRPRPAAGRDGASGYVRWRHETNRGSCAHSTVSVARQQRSARPTRKRCDEFLHQLDPDWDRVKATLRASVAWHEAGADHRHHRPGRALPRQSSPARGTRSTG